MNNEKKVYDSPRTDRYDIIADVVLTGSLQTPTDEEFDD